MKTFRFKSICLISQREQKARRLTFDPKLNLIVGENHTGKSSLIKSLFTALGARPEGKLEKWDPNTIVLVEFSIDTQTYYVVQQLSYRALFSSDGKIQFATNTSSAWGNEFSRLIGFNLPLTGRNQEIVQADARAFFLPFYINQDGSWHSNWSTFSSIQQFKSPFLAILEYFTGVKPPIYYELRAQVDLIKNDHNALQRELKIVVGVRDRLDKNLFFAGPKIDPAIFQQDIKRLTESVTRINAQQEKLRDAQVKDQETIEILQYQVNMAREALRTYDDDVSFLKLEEHQALVCPICRAEHPKTFMDILNYAEDARVLRELVIHLQSDTTKVLAEAENNRARLGELDIEYYRLSRILSTRRGDFEFGDVVKGIGAEVAFAAFEEELETLRRELDRLQKEISLGESQLEELTSRRRSTSIQNSFRENFAKSKALLNLPPTDMKNIRLNSRPDVSGSGGPRSILAYYGALWSTIFVQGGSFNVSIVVDAPQQQGQDANNLPKMIEYVARNLPQDSQVILGIEGKTTERFDKIIELNSPYNLLKGEEYKEVSAVIEPYIKAMHQYLFPDLLS